ncbi:tRNA (adenosine(37)-N6)-threonylcarbamoyltransferase complex dimerization subunit type 1 TsaB [Catenuloplanes atrovinosus]|uniref:tRNA threonylcarbamoyladenosine biosynthesis protein TsaB n=1 Tax=Catenuloplanes atrovinosus TaxID=137266 RepID=A0AAE3YZN4_9ACTN|nr:tRNA (adenosine(37)-N6)-threonylcarbamoyltransferase complex dimerization subunit type 1 TsaB [Catenuloplanes atrovinosus]MDR7281061.1 tRNA threonylcarbamoyladenosine biosynthesis protein TsaB [Catenuloplanes atrovinosus]
MGLTLAIETSSINYGVTLDGTETVLRRDDPSFTSIGGLVETALAAAGRTPADIALIAVNLGPGNLSSVRAGVAYANGLAFSLGRRVVGVHGLRVLAFAAAPDADLPVLCLRNAGAGNVYAAVYEHGKASLMRHGTLSDIAEAVRAAHSEIILAGSFRDRARELLAGVSVTDSGVEVPSSLATYTLTVTPPADADWAPADFVSPINEQTPPFTGEIP